MSFLSKLLTKSSAKSKASKTNKEENKTNNKGQGLPSAKKSKKALEKERALHRINLATLYNRDENYKPFMNNAIFDYYSLYEKNLPRFKQLVEEETITDKTALGKLAWQGIPAEIRPNIWKILLDYVPLNQANREATIARKREEYAGFIQKYLVGLKSDELDETDKKALKLVKDDVHRTQPDYPLYHHDLIQEMMTRLLWVWHVRHPASGYVQGINDLTTPFIAVFMSEYMRDLDFNTLNVPANFEERCTPEIISKVEADTFWCLSKILNGILDNYTFSQSGTHRALDTIKEITKKIDPELFKHLQKRGVDFTFFSFRWIFCLLVREFPLRVGLRLFDTYIADEQGFNVFHFYVCAALLLKWTVKLKKMNFTEIMLFLQNLPTKDWNEQDVEMILGEAYVFKTLYGATPGNSSPS